MRLQILCAGRPGVGRYLTRILAVGTVVFGAGRSEAAVRLYRLSKTQVFTQSSDTQPIASSGLYGGLSVDASSVADLSAARVTTTQSAPPREYVLADLQNGSWTNLKDYPSLAAMDGDLPSNDQLVFSIEGGSLGAQTASMSVPATNLFSSNLPYFTSNAFTRLNGLDTTAEFAVTWDGFAQVAGANRANVFFTINRVSDNFQVFGNSYNNSAKSIQFPENTLTPNTAYRANLTYSSRIVNVDSVLAQAIARSCLIC